MKSVLLTLCIALLAPCGVTSAQSVPQGQKTIAAHSDAQNFIQCPEEPGGHVGRNGHDRSAESGHKRVHPSRDARGLSREPSNA